MATVAAADLPSSVDDAYEFCAPRFFDFLNEETDEEIRQAERWFETSLSYAPSPFMARIRVGRTVQVDGLCDFGNVEKIPKEPESVESVDLVVDASDHPQDEQNKKIQKEAEPVASSHVVVDKEVNAGDHGQEVPNRKISFEFVPEDEPSESSGLPRGDAISVGGISKSALSMESVGKEASQLTFPVLPSGGDLGTATETCCTPKTRVVSVKGAAPTSLKNRKASEGCKTISRGKAPSCSENKMGKKASILKTKPAAAPRPTSPLLASVRSVKGTALKIALVSDIALENQAIKKQKLDGGKARQILNVKCRALPHKSKQGSHGGSDLFASASKDYHESAPFVSAAELVRKFQSNTRKLNISRNLSKEDTSPAVQRRLRLTLTRPKDPELETAHRVRAVRVKSSAELEEEMLAKIPKFKARPVNKKILEAPSLPALARSTPAPPEFQEFHLKTTERAYLHAETLSTVSSAKDLSCQIQARPLKLSEPKPPQLETALRARPLKIKSSQELELEELEKIPKFKARPLNKKIMDSKGDLGLYCNRKPQVTTPQEFHFATDERLGPPTTVVVDLFDKLSLRSEPQDKQDVPRITRPNPFHLQTEERGIEKEKQFTEQLLQKQLEEERARIPKANPYPYTTDYPVIPPRPEPKECTKPQAFQLESLVRHEDELQRQQEEKQRIEKEEAEKRQFKAQPILRDDPIPLPERERKPLTEVQEFVLHVDHRAVDRSQFDKKIKEKEVVYKRLREECESAKMIEEEKAVKQMRRTMVPHARPLPKFDNPFLPQKSSKEATKPLSPHLHVAQREQRRHASHMR